MTRIATVSGPGLTLSQGPVVTAAADAMTVQTGPTTTATGKPVPSVRKK